MMLGIYNLSVIVGSLISGRLGGLYDSVSPLAFWSIHASLVAVAGAIFAGLAWPGIVGRLAPTSVSSFECGGPSSGKIAKRPSRR